LEFTLASPATRTPLDTARRKVYFRALPLLFVCYIIAYVDRNNVSIAQLTMPNTLPEFTKAVIGFGSGVFFLGYFLLEIPGTLIVERWSASKWICRIMITWGIIAAMTAFVTKPSHFYAIRFLLGLAEAGFFPGVIVYLTHWFPTRDRARALSIFFVASPIAMIIGNFTSQLMLDIGENGNALFLGLKGWQCIFIFWGIPAVIMGVIVILVLTDRPSQAKWLTQEEREALEAELEKEKAAHKSPKHLSVISGLLNPNVLMLCLVYFGVVTGNYGIEIFLPSILEDWYGLGASKVTLLAMIPSVFVVLGQLFIGWSSDRFHERRWHATLPIVAGAIGLICATLTQGNLILTLICFTIAATGMKAYMPAFWALPNMFLTAAAAAGSIGLINSVGNLGGFLGPTVVGKVKTVTGSYDIGLYFLATTCLTSASIVFLMPYLHRRLSELKSTTAKLQTLGVVALLMLLIFLGGSRWVGQQLKPWGIMRQDVTASELRDDKYVELLAASMDDWFIKRPKIRDALAFRLDEFKASCSTLAENPPKQITIPNLQQQLSKSLKGFVDDVESLKKSLTERDKENDNRYRMTVENGLTAADEMLRSAQKSIRELVAAN
jgi:ACS family tartrate transporter-like MFS transporter